MITIIKSGLVSGVIMAVFAMATYIVSVGNIFTIETNSLINIGVIAFMTSIVSVAKSVGTTERGAFLGAVQIK